MTGGGGNNTCCSVRALARVGGPVIQAKSIGARFLVADSFLNDIQSEISSATIYFKSKSILNVLLDTHDRGVKITNNYLNRPKII